MNVYDACLKALNPKKHITGLFEPLKQLIKCLHFNHKQQEKMIYLIRCHEIDIKKLKAQRPIKIIRHVAKAKKK